MLLKLIMQFIGSDVHGPLEVWYKIPSDRIMDEAFFRDLLLDEFLEEVSDYLNCQLDDYSELFDSITFEPKARYSYENSTKLYRKLALDNVKKYAQQYCIMYSFIDAESEKELFRAEFDLESYLEMVVNDPDEFRVGRAMIKGMEQYVASASWNTAYRTDNKPIMWFGKENETPEEGWILNIEKNPATGKDWKSFWLCNDSWDDWQNRVPDANNVFLTWMTAECGDSLPSLEEVLKKCPIDVEEQDDYSTLTKKITDLIRDSAKDALA